MARDAKAQRGDLPVAFTALKCEGGVTPVTDWVRDRLADWTAGRRMTLAPIRRGRDGPRRPGRVRHRPHQRRPSWAGPPRCPSSTATAPSTLRRGRPQGSQARVCVLGAMSAPLGGDRLGIEATAEAGAHLHLTAAAATVALRGPTPEHATYDVWLTWRDTHGCTGCPSR